MMHTSKGVLVWALLVLLGTAVGCGETSTPADGPSEQVLRPAALDLGIPFRERLKFSGSDTRASDSFGIAVDIEGDLAVIGAHQDDDQGSASGVAFVFARNQGGPDNWGEVAKLQASDGNSGNAFGFALDLDGERVLVGALDGDGVVNGTGAAYLFDLSNLVVGSTVNEVVKLQASVGAENRDARASDDFGVSVALQGDTAIVGARFGGNDGNDANSNGAAYVFDLSVLPSEGTALTHIAKLEATDGDNGSDEFGYDVAIDGDNVVVGARVGDGVVNNTGAVYLFDIGGIQPDTVLTEVIKLQASVGAENRDARGNDGFGRAVDIQGNTVVVGARFGGNDGNNRNSSGAAYVFDISTLPDVGPLTHIAKLEATDGDNDTDEFGFDVNIDGNIVAATARLGDGGVNNIGATYIFDIEGIQPDTVLTESQKFVTSDGGGSDEPRAVALDQGRLLLGVFRDDDAGSNAGAAYIFERKVEATLSADASFSENGGTATVTLTLDQTTTDTVTATIAIASDAVEDTDYAVSGGGVITIVPGQTEGTLTLTGIDDDAISGNIPLTLTLAALNEARDFAEPESVQVVLLDDEPTARDDVFIVSRGSTGNALDVLANDSDNLGLGLTITAVGQPDGGGIATARGGRIFYTPDPAFSGAEVFTYTVSNGGSDATATVTITVPGFCTGASDLSAFEVTQEWFSASSGGADRGSAVVADLDGNGTTEILIENSTGANDSTRVLIYEGTNGNNAAVVDEIVVSYKKMGNIALGDVDEDGDIEVIVIDNNFRVRVYSDFTAGQTPMVQMAISDLPADNDVSASVGKGPSHLHLADINQDGRPEIITGNNVFAFTGAFDSDELALRKVAGAGTAAPRGSGGGSSGARNFPVGTTVAFDILPDDFCTHCQGMEIVAGPVVYALVDDQIANPLPADQIDLGAGIVVAADLNAMEGLNNAYLDGPVAMADLDLDGKIDIAVSGRKNTPDGGFGIYVWNPIDGELSFMATPNGQNDTSGPIIANVFRDQDDPALADAPLDMPEIIVVNTSRISAVNLQKGGTFWEETTTDGSGSTGITVFDFNGDGIKEIVYRDQRFLRVMYGGAEPFPQGVDDDRNWTRFDGITSGTGHDQAIVADVDDDGEAEIVTTGAGRLRVFGRGGAARWIPARNIWNQYSYHVTNINDDGTIPQVQPNHSLPLGEGDIRPFNVFKEQSVLVGDAPGQIDPVTGLLFPPVAPDAALNLVSVTPQGLCGEDTNTIEVVVSIENVGDDDINPDTPVSLYNGDPRRDGAALIQTEVLAEGIPQGESRSLTATIPDQGDAFDLFVVFNDRGTQDLPFINPSFVQGECSLVNNFDVQPGICGADSDDDGVDDADDPDSDNDGILDIVELDGNDVSGDTDNDNIPDWRDPDSDGFVDLDNNGTDDRFDFDGDGVPNHIDPDSDNDGITDIVENGGGDLDADGDGRADDLTDDDGDGLLAVFDADDDDADNVETLVDPTDSNNDGTPDSLSLDSDGDGLFDVVEAGLGDINNDGIIDAFTDDDGDGLASAVDPTEDGTPADPGDFDNDDLFDFQDGDDDNDTIPTAREVLDSIALGDNNVDGDDQPNWLDDNADGEDETDGIEGTGDIDGDGVPNYLDINDNDGPNGDLDGDGLTNANEEAIGTNPLERDSDGDGINDFIETDGGQPINSDDDDLIDARDIDADNDGILDEIEGTDDVDNDNIGNWRDPDSDGDDRDDEEEGNVNSDEDDLPNFLDPDDDNDTILTIDDNCHLVANFDQLDTDNDNIGDACDEDDDEDGVPDVDDNCPLTANPGQEDADDDNIGDACEGDQDEDGVLDDDDNCVDIANPDQTDTDDDDLGDACDTDDDNDNVDDGDDNCPLIANEDQTDTDEDGIGDACDDDDDNDGVDDGDDNCPLTANDDQEDLDDDGQGDVCDEDDDDDGVDDEDDNCPRTANPGQEDADDDNIGDACEGDQDEDGVSDDDDNCVDVANPDQEDRDGDEEGDACDDDIDGDGLDNDTEDDLGTDPEDADTDNDGVIDGDEGGENGEPGDDPDEDDLINALDPDSDDDGILDGTEQGLTEPHPDTDEDAENFVPDEDPDTTTDPVSADTDEGTLADGDEDTNRNGRVDDGETDPNDPSDDVIGDTDEDGVPDDMDNCPEVPNPDQADEDDDGQGDACDPDRAGEPCEVGVGECRAEGTLVIDDNGAIVCDATEELPAPEEDFSCDGLDNNCDGQIDEGLECDEDDDGVPSPQDNCPGIANPDQSDADGDGIGDACDEDFTSDEDNIVGDDLTIRGGACSCTTPATPTEHSPLLLLLALLPLALMRRR